MNPTTPDTVIARLGFSVVLMALVVTAPASGQRLPPMPHAVTYAITVPAAQFRVDTAKVIPKTYWLEGGIMGGVAMGIFGLEFARGMRDDNESHVLGDVGAFMLGAGLGFTVGALIGGQFPKH